MSQQEIGALLTSIFVKEELKLATFSTPLIKDKQGIVKVTIRAIELKGPRVNQRVYQLSRFSISQVFHHNFSLDECLEIVKQELMPHYKQVLLQTRQTTYQLLTNKKGFVKVLKKPAVYSNLQLEHNRVKKYILSEDQPPAFLQLLGIANSLGKVIPAKRDKFLQINHFLDIVETIFPLLPDDQLLSIADFGCGKAYLTFALYYYLTEIKKRNVCLTGIDLKEEVIIFCQQVAKQLAYDQLHFVVGYIDKHHFSQSLDLVISLHACNTATDHALARAIHYQAKVILAAPCCQHELADQLAQPALNSLLRHGIIKEKLAALVTDAARAELLTMQGYKTQVIEFIDSLHTPKNLLIKAIKGCSSIKREKAQVRYQSLESLLSIKPLLKNLLS